MKPQRFAFALALVLLAGVAATADDTSLLHPPKGASVALVVFEDLECPRCAMDHPTVEQAAQTYKIPVVVYDFPLPMHPWSFQAAVLARYFSEQSKELGMEFRDFVFKNQQQITPDNLRAKAEEFAAAHKVSIPFAVDPQGKLAAAVNADKNLGQRVGIQHTPTVYVVTNKPNAQPVEVTKMTDLFQTIDQAKRETASTEQTSAPVRARRRTTKKPTT
jgi:protein-disulfide isomerase